MRRLYKLSGFIFLFSVFIIGAVLLRFYAVTDVNRRRVGAWFTSRMSRIGLRFLGMSTQSTGGQFLEPGGKLIISNHMSYLDILVYAAIKPTVFISSVEIEKTFLLGFVTKLGGSFFVERRDPKLIKQETQRISELLDEGFNIILFPEGTSTDGSVILPFRSSLLAAATGVDVVPACIKYEEIDGKPFSSENCDYVCWYGDMRFAPHLWSFLGTRSVKARATFFEPISSATTDRKKISRQAHSLITAKYFGAA